MATDYSVRIDCDISELTADKVTDLTRELLAALQNAGTVTLAFNNAYEEGATTAAVDNVLLDIGAGGTVDEDWGFRVLFDSTISKDKKIEVTRSILAVVSRYTVDTIKMSTTYVVGVTPTFQVVATIT